MHSRLKWTWHLLEGIWLHFYQSVPRCSFIKTCFLVTCGCAYTFSSLEGPLVSYQYAKSALQLPGQTHLLLSLPLSFWPEINFIVRRSPRTFFYFHSKDLELLHCTIIIHSHSYLKSMQHGDNVSPESSLSPVCTDTFNALCMARTFCLDWTKNFVLQYPPYSKDFKFGQNK